MKRAYINANIFTAKDDMSFATAFTTKDGFIDWIGQEAELPDDTFDETVNLQGKTVIPGFTDAHVHPVMLADFSKKISCLPPSVNSISDISAEIRKVRETLPPDSGHWIEGWGYDEGKLAEHRSPNRYDLDAGCSDLPVSILRTCGHIRCVNSKALELAGIDRNTPDPPGGEIERDENGEPTGVLKENARNLIVSIMPTATKEEIVSQVCDLGQLLLSQGIVAVTDMGNLDNIDPYDYYQMAAEQNFEQEVGVYYFWENFCNSPEKNTIFAEEKFSADHQIHVAGLKLIGDGSFSGHTAWVDPPYLGTNDCGICVCSDELLESAISFCKSKGCQLSVHAMGGKTIDHMVDRISLEENWSKTKAPHARLEHITEPSVSAIKKAADNKLAFVTQPIFLYCEIESYLTNLGPERTKKTYPIRTLLEQNVDLALSTDAPATSWAVPSDPFSNLKAAVTRTAYDGTDCGKDQCIDICTAIRLYTRESARVSGFKNLGMLQPGYKADFVVLDRNLFTIPPEEIDQVKVLKTYIRDRLVYEK